MWTARGAYKDHEGAVRFLQEHSPMWTSRDGLVAEVLRSHPGISHSGSGWYRWESGDGVERYVVIEEA